MRAVIATVLTGAAVLTLPPRRRVLPQLRDAWGVPRPEGREPGEPTTECLSVLDSLIILLQSGTTAAQALDLATRPLRSAPTETARGWRWLAEESAQDGDVPAAWEELGRRWRCAAPADVATAWRMSVRHGCPLAEAMNSAAGGVRAAERHRAAVTSAVAGARATMGVLMLLPPLGVALGLVLGVDVSRSYLGASGFVTLWPGLALLWAGHRWAGRMVRAALHPSTRSVA